MSDSTTRRRGESAGRRPIREDRYVLVLFLILGTLISSAFLGNSRFGVLIPLAFGSLTLWVALSTSDAGPKARFIGRVVLSVTFAAILIAEVFHYTGLARFGFFLTMLALSVVTPIVIIRRLLKHLTINVDTVAGAADIYLLIGLFFSVVYMTIGAIQAGALNSLGPSGLPSTAPATAFFYASRPRVPSDFVYYSFVTLATVGYGDLTATSSLGRLLSATEALIGQLYLVTVLAVLVSNIGRSRRRPLYDADLQLAADPGSSEPPE